MFCMRCGAALPEGAKFCTACGQPAGAPPARAAAPAASPAFSRYLALVEGRAGAPGPGGQRWKHRGCAPARPGPTSRIFAPGSSTAPACPPPWPR